MKRTVLLLVLSFLFLHNGFTQNSKPLPAAETKNFLCHKWKLSFLEGKGKKMSVPNNVPPFYLEFKKDGTLAELDGKKNYTGSWNYDPASNIITTNDQDGKEEYTIMTINGEQLVMKSKFRGVLINLGMQRAD